MRRNNSFTLIEVLIAFALIALSIGAIGFSIPQLLKSEKMESDVLSIMRLIDLAQTHSFSKEEDVCIDCYPTQDGVVCELNSSSFHRKYVCKKIDSLCFNGKSAPFSLSFPSALNEAPIGELEAAYQDLRRYVHLPGYPGGLTISKAPIPLRKYHETDYPKEILPAA